MGSLVKQINLVLRHYTEELAGITHVKHLVVGKRMRVVSVVFERDKLITIVAVQAVFGAKPQKPVAILATAPNKSL